MRDIKRPVDHVAHFYSVRAGFPLGDLRSGEITVVGSDQRYRQNGRTKFFMAILHDRALVSTQHEMVAMVRPIVEKAEEPCQLHDEAIISSLIKLCAEATGDATDLYQYEGVKLYCDPENYVLVMDSNVRRITRRDAGEAIAALREVGIPDDVDYLLADNAAFAYYVDNAPVGFAGTHPVGEFSDRIGNICVGVLGRHHRRGYGKALVSATTGELLHQGRTAVWGTAANNAAAIKTAQSVGYNHYCWLLELRFR